MSWIEIGLTLGVVVLFFISYCFSVDIDVATRIARNSEQEIKGIHKRLEDLQNELTYTQLRPQIKEYMELKGHTILNRYNNRLYFYDNEQGQCCGEIRLHKVEQSLKDLKLVLEKNCPKKCKKKS